jgi:hypothetical protein
MSNYLNIDFDDILKNYGIYIIFFIFFSYLYIKFHFYENQSLSNLFKFYSSLLFFLTIINMYITINYQYFDTIRTQVNTYNSMFDELNTSIYDYFTANLSLKYYYDELYFGKSDYKDSDRNKLLEQIITGKILSQVDSFINYIDSFKKINKNTFQIFLTEEKLKKLLNLFFKSNIFLENWIFYKKNLSLKWTIDYIDLYIDY